MLARLVLDFDGSVGPLPGERRIALGSWQEQIRFGCTLGTLAALERVIGPELTDAPAAVFLGSGDFHHVSHLLIRRLHALGRPIQVVVLDNHPDNMRYPFGIHCGSWVWHTSRLPFVSCVHVLGITSRDVEAIHAVENHLRNLRHGRVRYWCIDRNLGWMRRLGIRGSASFSSVSAMLDAFAADIGGADARFYVSIDKDALSPQDARTNWDQGVMRVQESEAAIGLLRGRIVAADVTGEVSVHAYRSPLKRLLSALDGQPRIAPDELVRWQAGHHAIDLRLLEALSG
jgi:hypothetical protein